MRLLVFEQQDNYKLVLSHVHGVTQPVTHLAMLSHRVPVHAGGSFAERRQRASRS